METRKNPNEEQLAHVLEMTLNDDPEKSEVAFIFSLGVLTYRCSCLRLCLKVQP